MSRLQSLSNKHMRQLAREAERQGWRWKIGGSGHLKWTHPAVRGVVITASTPRLTGDHKPAQLLRTALRRGHAQTRMASAMASLAHKHGGE